MPFQIQIAWNQADREVVLESDWRGFFCLFYFLCVCCLIPRSLRGRFLFRSISFTDKLAFNVNVYSAKQAIVGLLENAMRDTGH